MPIRIFLFIALIVLAPRIAAAQELEEALAQAYSNNPDLIAARAEMRALDEGVPQALSGWRPTISANGSFGKQWVNDHSFANLDRSNEPAIGSITVTQPLFSGFGTVSGRDVAEEQVLAGRARLIDIEQQVLLAAVRAYMQVVRDRAILDLNKNNEKVIAEQLDATQKRFEVGEVTKTDVAQAESRLQGSIAARIAAEGTLATSIAAYRQIIGDTPGDLSTPKAMPNLPTRLEDTIALAMQSPLVLAAQYDANAAQHQIDVAFSEMLPHLSLEGSWSYSDEAFSEQDRSDVGTVMLQLQVPLYQAGAPDSRVRQAKQSYQQRRALIESARRTAEQRAQESWRAFETAEAQIKSFTEQVRAANIALDGVQQEAVVGARTVLDVLDAEIEALQAKVNLAVAETDLVVAKYRVASAIGELTAPSLGLNVPLYDPQDHYNKVRDQFIGTGPDE